MKARFLQKYKAFGAVFDKKALNQSLWLENQVFMRYPATTLPNLSNAAILRSYLRWHILIKEWKARFKSAESQLVTTFIQDTHYGFYCSLCAFAGIMPFPVRNSF